MYKIYQEDKIFFETEDFKKFGTEIERIVKDYQLIEAAGGIVKNELNEILFIFRKGKWDLPKGKIEENETPELAAIREVEEECGLKHLFITSEKQITYHLYKMKGKTYLKRTFWFNMKNKGDEIPVPQVEEDITMIKWANNSEMRLMLTNSYPLIQDLIIQNN